MHKSGFKLKGEYTVKVYKKGTKELLRESHHKNLIMLGSDTGVNLFLKHLRGTTTYPLELTIAKIGTGSTAPADGDTDLQTPTVSVPRSTGVIAGNNTLNTEWFFTDDELPNGTYNEFGLFCGTQIFCRSIISPAHTKASGEDTLFAYTIVGDN